MPSPYRTSAFASRSRRVTGFGTGERLVLHLPLSPIEVVDALSTLAQHDQPSRRELKAGKHRPFRGVVKAPSFHLRPLRTKASMLDVHGDIRPRGSASVVTIDITLQLPAIAFTIIVAMFLLVAVLVCRPGAGALIYLAARAAIFVAAAGALVVTSIRFGISDVRRTIFEALERGSATARTTTARESDTID